METEQRERKPFEPLGERAKWEEVYDLLQNLQPDEVLTYQRVVEVTGLDLREDRGPLYDARRHFEERESRTLEAVPNVGYRVVFADEHARLAQQHAKKAGRQYRKAKRKVKYVREVELTTDAQRAELADLRARVGSLEQHARWSSKKLAKADEAIKGLGKRTSRVETASEKLQRKMAAMEAEVRDLRKQVDS